MREVREVREVRAVRGEKKEDEEEKNREESGARQKKKMGKKPAKFFFFFSSSSSSSSSSVFPDMHLTCVVEPHHNYTLFDHVMTSLHALHALPLAFHALSSIVVEVETTPACVHFSLLYHPFGVNLLKRERKK